MDKIILVLQDKETIKELAKDENVQIKIKDAIVDSIAKRVAQGNIVGVNLSLQEAVTEAIADKVFSDGWRKLSPSAEVKVKNLFNKSVNELIVKFDKNINKELNAFKEDAVKSYKDYIASISDAYKEKIDNANIEGIVEDFLKKRIKDALNK